MKNKVLLNIIDTNTRLIVISTLAKLKVDFIEINYTNDLKFKYSLFKDEIIMFIHEISDVHYEKDFKKIKNMVSDGVKIIAIAGKYSVKIIDDALEAGASDVIVLPVDSQVFEDKFKAVMSFNQIQIDETKRVPYDKVLVSHEVLETEIARAKRGNYQLSLVMFQITGLIDDEMNKCIDDLKLAFRETDAVYRYTKREGIVVCPFTDKENIVEVENKVRTFFYEKIQRIRISTKLNIYGITFPKDGEDIEDIVEKLKDGLHNSIIMSKMEGTLDTMNRAGFQRYYDMMRKKYE